MRVHAALVTPAATDAAHRNLAPVDDVAIHEQRLTLGAGAADQRPQPSPEPVQLAVLHRLRDRVVTVQTGVESERPLADDSGGGLVDGGQPHRWRGRMGGASLVPIGERGAGPGEHRAVQVSDGHGLPLVCG